MDRRKFLGWLGMGTAAVVAAQVPVPKEKPMRNPKPKAMDYSRAAFEGSTRSITAPVAAIDLQYLIRLS